MQSHRPVVVKRIPEWLNAKQARLFVRDMDAIINSDRPQLVFDCSQVRQLDAAGVDMLLHCLARAIKHDGDIKLAAVSPQIQVILEMTRTDRLFEIYDSASDAVLSFSRFLPSAIKRPASVFTMPAGRAVAAPAAEGQGADLAA
jgi:anti-sigma B factor antagonist